jgi:sugar lactone lactonase YvrE
MKKTLYFISALVAGLLACNRSSGQIINTYAGNGIAGETGDSSAAILAEITDPEGIALDNNGNLYIADGAANVVRKVTPGGIIYTIAGTGTGGYNGDGIAATAAQLRLPMGIAVDKYGNIYIADNGNFRVRRIDTLGVITTVAGVGGIDGFGLSGDGAAATSAHLYATGVAVDNDQNIYIADGNSAVRMVSHATGIITTIAGGNMIGYNGDGGLATSASLTTPNQVVLDTAGNIYISDYGNNRVRLLTKATGIISTVAGTGSAGSSGDGGLATAANIVPYYLALDARGNLYITDMTNSRVRMVNKATGMIAGVAGSTATALGDGGPATSANLDHPVGIATNDTGTLYIADNGHYRIRRITGLPYTVAAASVATVGAGKGSIRLYPNPNSGTFTIAGSWSVADDKDVNIIVTDVLGHTIYSANAATSDGQMRAKIATGSALASGMYLVQLVRGDERTILHFVVQ